MAALAVAVLAGMVGMLWQGRGTSREFASMREEIAGLRSDTTAQFTSMRQEIAGLRSDTAAQFAAVREDLGGVGTQVAQQSARIDVLVGGVAELTVRVGRVEDRLGIQAPL